MAKRKSFSLNKDLQLGLSQTMSAVKNYAGALHFEVIPLSDIELDPDNPRDLALTFADLPQGPSKKDEFYQRKMKEIESLKSLSQTIKSQGLINPVVVYKNGNKYRLVAGERRCLASLLIHNTDIKAHVLDEKPTNLRRSLLQWVENSERQDLSLWERLGNIKQIMQHYQAENLANGRPSATILRDLLGCSLPHAMNYFTVIHADEFVLDAIKQDKLKNLEKAALITKLETSDLKKRALQATYDGISLKNLKAFVNQNNLIQKQQQAGASQEGRGRKALRVNLGHTKNTQAVKLLIEAMLNHKHYRQFSHQFVDINWTDYSAVSNAFKRLITILEATE